MRSRRRLRYKQLGQHSPRFRIARDDARQLPPLPELLRQCVSVKRIAGCVPQRSGYFSVIAKPALTPNARVAGICITDALHFRRVKRVQRILVRRSLAPELSRPFEPDSQRF
jgi:hypothetical protein